LFLTFLSVFYAQYRIKKTPKENSLVDLLLMGRQLTLPLFVATLVSTWYGGIFGVTQIAYDQGIYNFVTQGFFWYLSYLVFAFFLVKRIRHYDVLTLPDLIGKMFGPQSRRLGAIFNFFNVLPIAYAISIGAFIQIFTNEPLWICSSIGVAIVLCYSTFGGLRSVVFSDVVQFWTMCISVLLVVVFSYTKFGGLTFLKGNLPESHFSITGTMGWGPTLAWGFIAFSTLVDPNFYQRCFAARNISTAKKGIIISTLVWILFDICTTTGAMYARAVLGGSQTTDHPYLVHALNVLPNGLKGFFLAGVLATILSTLDSYLFLAGTTLTYDLFPKFSKHKKKAHALSILFVGALSIAFSIGFDGNIKKVWKTLGSYSAACLLVPVMLGYVFPGRIADRVFFRTCILGVICVTLWKNWERSGLLGYIDEIYIGAFVTALSVLLNLKPKTVKPSVQHGSKTK